MTTGKRGIVVLWISVIVITCLSACACARQAIEACPPIWDGEDGITNPPLRLSSSEVYDRTEFSQHLRSSHVMEYTESWLTPKRPQNASSNYHGRTIGIDRWTFEYPEDIDVWLGPKFGGWQQKGNIGDASVTSGGHYALFRKGLTLVRIQVNSNILWNNQAYLDKIARFVANKL